MELVNATKMPAGYTMGMDPDGRESLVVVVKGTFAIPDDGGAAEPAEQQAPLVMADEFTGEPGRSATLYEADYVPVKPRCDVLLSGSAHAPGGTPAQRVTVALALGGMKKSFDVVGDRAWDNILLSTVPSEPAPFLTKPITYDLAYGGVDEPEGAPEKAKAYAANPVGVGYYPATPRKALVGKPLPNTEETGQPVKSPKGEYRPMSFGPIGRNFAGRIALAGTYDEKWLADVFPFLPKDFNPLYYQSAPPDQQIDYPRGGETVVLENLTPAGRTTFRLPTVEVPVEFTDDRRQRQLKQAALDTIIIEPDRRRVLLVWRASVPLRRNIFEMKQAVVGRMSRAWERARESGKTYYPSLAAAAAARREEEAEE